MEVEFVWSDSLGVKSACTKLVTEDCSILIDPGAAEMQPSFPLPDSEKVSLRNKAREKIMENSKDVDHFVISHYHYDHHFLPGFSVFDFGSLFSDSEIWVKNPNCWVNKSQRERAREFFKSLCETFDGDDYKELEIPPSKTNFQDPVPNLEHALSKDFGDYQDRREELLEKWSDRFQSWEKVWTENNWIRPPELSQPVNFAENSTFREGDTVVEFSHPMFHGIEYSKTGWVFSTIVKSPTGKTFIHSSDLQGPTIEDQADWIIEKEPDILFLDGPATYLYGYMLNKANLQRAVDNACRILEESELELLIYDHHLVRDERFRERTKKFWKKSEDLETQVVTTAGLKGRKPKVLEE